eukprot:CAMPEP_0177430300 /NCGR_PEP_ID=MMETSP0368-20130122/75593_1 /TAXON_ID=447022 ORGANISM="Scrippsiella hangoei-like, Strain SHHI-4" /NCGR_SAMPLE_ID=MMETSP0368 /ASSEMBLY_ACC=CAM_ASM_000363 /LENGTH=32 /DNA_ID= /DNA_START= /DNA_END= /DNA_ORIENTATION=
MQEWIWAVLKPMAASQNVLKAEACWPPKSLAA